MRDRIPPKPLHKECGIVNLDSNRGSGTHWVAYWKWGNYIEYFDSFGNLQPPLEIINYLGDNILYNYKRKQQFNTFVCGHLCLQFLLKFNKLKKKTYMKYFLFYIIYFQLF